MKENNQKHTPPKQQQMRVGVFLEGWRTSQLTRSPGKLQTQQQLQQQIAIRFFYNDWLDDVIARNRSCRLASSPQRSHPPWGAPGLFNHKFTTVPHPSTQFLP